MQARVGELVADADERPPRVERLGEQVEQRAAALEQVDQRAVRAELLVAHLVEQARGAADVDALLVVLGLGEGGLEHLEEGALGGRQARVGEPPAELGAAEREADELVVQVLAPPSARGPGSTGRSNA